METLKILGVDCNNCAANVRKALEGVKGIEILDIGFQKRLLL